MKKSKKIIMILSMMLLLAGCGDKDTTNYCNNCQCQQTTSGGDNVGQEQDLITVAVNKITEIFNNASQLTTDQELKSYITDLKTEALLYLKDFNFFVDEEDALETATNIANSFASEQFKEKVVAKLTNRLFTLISSTKDFAQQAFFTEVYNNDVNYLISELETFEDIIEQYNSINTAINEYIGSTPESDKYIKYKEEVREYGMSLFSDYTEYLDKNNVIELINTKLEAFKTITSEDDAKELVNSLKGEVYSAMLSMFKNNLCSALDNFKDLIGDYVSNVKIIDDSFTSIEDDKASIQSEDAFEVAMRNYNHCIEYYTDELSSRLSAWGKEELEKLHNQYVTNYQEGTIGWNNFYKEYWKIYSLIENNSSDILDMENDIKTLLQEFETYCLQ